MYQTKNEIKPNS